MNKNFFIFLLIAAVVGITGWIYYLNTTAGAAEPVEQISSKWWDSAHADITSESFVHWNEDEPAQVPQDCAKCHSGQGFIDFLGQDGSAEMVVDEPAAVESVVSCAVCHNEKASALEIVRFPSGAAQNIGLGDALCATCHSGMAAGVDVDQAVSGFGDDEIVPEASFVTPHYYFAAATWMGGETRGGYEYPAKSYVGQFGHAQGVQTCTQCHDAHSLHMRNDYETDANLCAACHPNVTDYSDYRDVFVDGVDYDGDGTVEGVYHEIQGMREILHQAMNAYSFQEIGEAAGWADQFPYLFVDADANGRIEGDEAAFSNAYSSFTPRLMRAAFNYQFSAKDPAGYVHNGKYVLQLLYDAIEDLSGFVDIPLENLTRPQAY